MPRRKRSYLPGGAFHITTRTHSGEFWFEDLRSEIVEIVGRALRQTDAWLMAFSIMTNHIHLVLRQGADPLWRLMHPVCQRTAYAVHRRLKRKGYVMGYRYHDTPCREESHLRNAILYVHRNPVEAGMCKNPAEYQWSSDAAYRLPTHGGTLTELRPAIELFASGLPDRTPQQDYADFYAWYDACKLLGPDDERPHSPGVTAGDVYWMQNFGTLPIVADQPKPDLRDVVRQSLIELAPQMTMEHLRAGMRGKPMIAVRDAVIERALQARVRPVEIARFLNVSDTTVSRVRVTAAARLWAAAESLTP